MSLIIAVYVREGIVMAADSRLTLTFPRIHPDGTQQFLSVTSSDSAKKLFLAPNNVGIATCGVADIGGVPVAGFVESFIVEKLKNQAIGPIEVANELKLYFQNLSVRPGTIFQVAGYCSNASGLEQIVFYIDPAADTIVRLNQPNTQGVNWNGEIDILQRLYNDLLIPQPNAQQPISLPAHGIPFEFFTLQDALDFAVHGIRSTIESIRFQQREKTVGGPIDILVIQPDSSQWISQKNIVPPI